MGNTLHLQLHEANTEKWQQHSWMSSLQDTTEPRSMSNNKKIATLNLITGELRTVVFDFCFIRVFDCCCLCFVPGLCIVQSSSSRREAVSTRPKRASSCRLHVPCVCEYGCSQSIGQLNWLSQPYKFAQIAKATYKCELILKHAVTARSCPNNSGMRTPERDREKKGKIWRSQP